jgi:hypothetical protein
MGVEGKNNKISGHLKISFSVYQQLVFCHIIFAVQHKLQSLGHGSRQLLQILEGDLIHPHTGDGLLHLTNVLDINGLELQLHV